jgi:hypothetical protein
MIGHVAGLHFQVMPAFTREFVFWGERMPEAESGSAPPKMVNYAFRFAVIFIPVCIVATAARAFGLPQLFLMILELIIPAWIVAGRFKDAEGRSPTAMETTKFTLISGLSANIIGAALTEGLFVLQGKSPAASAMSEWHVFLSAKSQLMVIATFAMVVLFQLALIWLLFRFVEGGGAATETDALERNPHDISL